MKLKGVIDVKKSIKQIEAVCKMAERKALYGLYITFGIQGLTRRSLGPYNRDAMLISATFYPHITLEKIDGSKESYPLTLGN